jgi:N-glycosylase/DNA lyase
MRRAADSGEGIAILKQDEWETLFSFIVSQNNNIPRIRKILRSICAEYGKNLAEGKYTACPLSRHGECPTADSCRGCGICFSFPTPTDVLSRPEGLLPSKPGFRYRYLLAAAEAVAKGSINLEKIREENSFDFTTSELKKIKGVGDKVAACVALFGFNNLEAFPIDVWMKKAINDYFSGHLDPKSFGKYAGVAQQYIFHYIRNIENGKQ